jgi:hypothetical protein
MSETVEQIVERLKLEEEEKQRAALEAGRRRREESARKAQERREEEIRRTAQLIASREPDGFRVVEGACVICGERRNLADTRLQVQFPPPMGRIDGSMCRPCASIRGGDWAERLANRIWQERSDLAKGWGWKRPPSPDAERTARVWAESKIVGHTPLPPNAPIPSETDEPEIFHVPRSWWVFTWSWAILAARRAGKPDPKRPKSPFSWLR